MNTSNGKIQNIQKDTKTPSKPRTQHLIKAKWGETWKTSWVWKNLVRRRKPLNTNSPTSRWTFCGSTEGRVYRIWGRNATWNYCTLLDKNKQSHKQRQVQPQKRSVCCIGTAQFTLGLFQTNWEGKKAIHKMECLVVEQQCFHTCGWSDVWIWLIFWGYDKNKNTKKLPTVPWRGINCLQTKQQSKGTNSGKHQ